MIQEKIFGNIGLNLDDDPRYFGADDTDRIQNMLPDVDGASGLLETHPGTTEISPGLSYGGNVNVIGSCKDPKANYLYYFVKAEAALDGNTIIQFDPVAETFRTIVFEEPLLLMGDHVYGAVIFGDYLIYNTLSDGLYKVNITYANRYYNTEVWAAGVYAVNDVVRRPDGTCWVCTQITTIGEGAPEAEPDYWEFEYYTYPTITATTFVLRNMPPVDRPSAVYGTDGARLQNNLLERTFQFAYRYKYVDGGYSTYSEYSDIYLPPNVETWSGDYAFELFSYNKLTISFTRGEPSVIEYVELVVREGNNGVWKYLAKITEDTTSFVFYNDENYESVDQDVVSMLEDAIPRVCADMSLIGDNRLVEARITEGFDNITPDVSMWPVSEAVTIITPAASVLERWDIYKESLIDLGFSVNTSTIDQTDFAANDVLRLRLSLETTGDLAADYTLTGPDVASKAALLAAIDGQLTALLGTNAVYVKTINADSAAWNNINDDNDDIEIQTVSEILYGYFEILDGTVTVSTNKWKTYKSGSVHPHGIEYFDAEFRHSTVQRCPGMDVYVDERYAYSTSLSYRIYLGWRIAHLAPSWAKYWRWVYAGNKTQSSFVQYTIAAVAAGAAPYDGYVEYNIAPLQTLKTSTAPDVSFPKSIIDPYVFSPGDRVKILTGAAAAGVLGPIISGAEFVDLPIAELDDTTNEIRIPAATGETYGAGTDSLIEIYTPRSFVEGSESFFAVGDIYPVITGGYHTAKQRATLTISSAAAGTVAGQTLFTTSTNHGMLVGDWVRIAGTTNYNGDFLVKTVGALNTFELQIAFVSNQTGTATPMAYGTLDCGDAFVIARAFSQNPDVAADGTLFPVESMHYSDFYLSSDWDKGKVNIESSIGEVTQNNVRWGNKYLSGSSVNNIFTFDPLDYKSTTDVYGDLERIGEMGDVLKLIFNHKVAGMYIGKTEYIDTQGSSVLAVSDSVLSNPNYSVDDYGTTIPQAVLFVSGRCYFIDLYNGCIVRNTANGSANISGTADVTEDGRDYKMQNYFKGICRKVLDEGESAVRMLMGWDNGRKLLYVSILHADVETRTVAFRESRGRWVAFLDFHSTNATIFPSCYEWIGTKFYSFLGGNDAVWDHDSDTSTALTIYAELKVPYVSVWGVLNPNHIKVFDSIAIHTDNKNWTGYVYVPASLSYLDGMESRLPAANFRVREGVLRASYMFNGKSLGNTFSLLGLHNGESLRGYVINNLLTVSGAAKLFKVDINSRISKV